jgi:DNA repair exonuclease SbcCD ATPase subunit
MTNTSGKTGIQPNNFISGLFNGDLFKKQNFSLSEVLSTSDVDAIKAYNKQIDNCVTSQTAFNRTMLNTSKEAQNIVAAANGNKVALDGLTKSSKAAELGMKALAMAGNMLLIYALTSAVDIIYKCATASDRLAESAAQMGSEFASTKSDISDYKTKIEELYQTINDDTSSYEDTYNARQELLKIQDEMIDKFGDEADAVKLVTDAINGQTDSLDTLTQDKWQETVNAFNSDRGKGWTEKVADAFANIGHGNNFQRMIDEMEDTEVTFHMIPMYGDDTYEEFSKKLKKDFGADITRAERDDAITLSGDLDTIHKQLLNIQTLAKGMGMDDTFLNDLGDQADEVKSKLDEYQEMYSQHVLYDKVLSDTETLNKAGKTYEESFNEINKAYEKYQDAFASGDEESIEKAKQNYAEIVQSTTEGLDDQSVIDYFNSMYPDLQEVVGGWNFEVKFKAAIDDDSDDFEKGVQDAVNKFNTVEDIKNYNPKVATDEQKDAYLQLKQYADDYGLTLDQLIDKLVQLGLLQSQSKSDLLNKLIPSKSIPTAGVTSALTDVIDSVDADEATKWVESLTEEEAKLANSKDFENALEEQKKKLNGASLSADDYTAALQTVKDKQNENSQVTSEDSFEIPDADILEQQISDLNSAIDSIQSAYDTLNSAVEEYNSNGGQLSIDTIQSLLSLSDEYLACLQVENGQLSLNADAMAQLAQAKLDEAQATAVTQAMTELQAIANGEAAQSTTNYITGNAALMSSLAQLSGSYEGVAQAAMTAAQAQELSAQISAASAKDKTATENVMKGLDTKLKLIQSTKNAISAGNFASVAKKSSSSGLSSKSSKDELKEAFQAEYDLLKHNLEMEYITEEQYYNGVQALNEKYFAGKEEYLDDYRKYEEEVYKGLKSYYKSYCDDMMDYYDKKLDASKMSYKEYCDSVSKMLADMHNSGKISDKDWYDYTKTMLEKQKDAYDRALSAITRRLQKEIDAWQAKIDALNDQNDVLNDQKDNYDKILSAVSNVYDKEIDRLNEQKDLLQDQIDALNDKNDALDLQYRKEQALYALQKAQQQRTRKLYVEGKGYIYDTDNEAIRDAQKDLDDITNEELINSLQKEQDKIQESIDILEKYKEKWNEIPDAWDKAVSEQLAIELWGQEYEKLILLNRTSDIENFKNKYLKIQSQINDNEELIKSYEEKVDYYNKLKDQWSSLSDEYSNSVDDMYAKMLLGQSWESDVLNGRLSTLNNFRNQYNDIQKSISDMAWQSANAQISALNAVKAAEATKAQTSGGSNGYSGSSGNVSSVSKPSQPKKDTVQHYWIYRTLGTFNTNGQASSKIGMLGGDGVISVGGKYLVVKWKKGYVTRGEASSNIVNYGGNGVYKRYASGTDNGQKGFNLLSENGDELFVHNDGSVDLVKGKQFVNFEGGEKVIPANETKEILKNQGNVEPLSDSDVITRKDGSILKPIHYEYENMLTNFIKDNPDYMYSMNTMSDNMCRDLFKNAENVNYDNRSVDNRVSIGEIHLHEVQNVDQFARELDRQLAGIVDQKLSRRKR